VGTHVLVVEDDVDNQEALALVLEFEGFRVSAAKSCGEALTRMRRANERPQVVLLDMRLPDGSGLDVFEAMRSDRMLADVPVLFMTADARSADSLRHDLGLVVIEKPFRLTTLIDEIASTVRRASVPPVQR
jgi:DNA-binding response OmpR family regulator